MREYNSLLAKHASKDQVLAILQAKPWYEVRDASSLADHTRKFPLPRGFELPNKIDVWIYAADPYNDGEGAVVYLFFNEKSRLVDVFLAMSES